MMRVFLMFCAFLVVGGLVFNQVEKDPGYVLIVWGQTSIEMSIWFGFVVLAAMLLLLWLALYIMRGGFRGFSFAKNKITGYSKEKAQQQTTAGLINFIEGNWALARKKLTRAAAKSPAPIINYLAAARCAYELGGEEEALELLHKAEKSAEDSDLAVALTQARMQLSTQQYEQASAILERAAQIKPDHPVVLSLQQQVYVALKDWASLKTLLPKLHRQDIFSEDKRHQLEATLYRESMLELIDKNKRLAEAQRYTAMNDLWLQVPAHLQQDRALLALYVGELIVLNRHDEAEQLLTNGIRRHWYDNWVDLYGLLKGKNTKHLLKTAELWLKDKPASAALNLTLGRLCLQNQQWGRAKDFFEKSLALQSRPETYAELARLQDYIGEQADSQQSCKQGLLSSVSRLAVISDFDKK